MATDPRLACSTPRPPRGAGGSGAWRCGRAPSNATGLVRDGGLQARKDLDGRDEVHRIVSDAFDAVGIEDLRIDQPHALDPEIPRDADGGGDVDDVLRVDETSTGPGASIIPQKKDVSCRLALSAAAKPAFSTDFMYASLGSTSLASTSSISASFSVTMPVLRLVCMIEGIWNVLPSRIRLLTAGMERSTSRAATRPPPIFLQSV